MIRNLLKLNKQQQLWIAVTNSSSADTAAAFPSPSLESSHSSDSLESSDSEQAPLPPSPPPPSPPSEEMDHGLPPPPLFHGIAGDLSIDFINQFEAWAAFKKLDDTTKVAALSLLFRGTASIWNEKNSWCGDAKEQIWKLQQRLYHTIHSISRI